MQEMTKRTKNYDHGRAEYAVVRSVRAAVWTADTSSISII